MRLDLPLRANKRRKRWMQTESKWEFIKSLLDVLCVPSRTIHDPSRSHKALWKRVFLEIKHHTWRWGGAVAAPFVTSPVDQIFLHGNEVALPGSLLQPPQCHSHLGKPLEPCAFTSIACECKPQREQICPSDLWLLPDGKNAIQICLSLCFLSNG